MYPRIKYRKCPLCKKNTLMVSKNGRPFRRYICRGKNGCGAKVSVFDYDKLMRHSWKKVDYNKWEPID